MRCPYCGADESKVIDSRPTEDGEKIRRRRECLSCKKRFTTYEIVETVPLMVIKKDRSREVFDRQKLLNGMLRACEKRPVSYEQLDAAVSRIEQVLLNFLENAVIHGKTTAQIQLRLSVVDGSAVFEVRDDGVGIDTDRLKTIFEGKLETPAAQPVDAKRNMGIGLSVCSSIIQAHGGTIGARNHPDGGAVFAFTLPTGEDETWKSKIES